MLVIITRHPRRPEMPALHLRFVVDVASVYHLTVWPPYQQEVLPGLRLAQSPVLESTR